jgi:hypothetical protein
MVSDKTVSWYVVPLEIEHKIKLSPRRRSGKKANKNVAKVYNRAAQEYAGH